MSTDFPTAPLAPGHKGAGGGAVEKSPSASHTKNLTLPVKLVPTLSGVTPTTPYWITQAEFATLVKEPAKLAEKLGLPPGSQSVSYDLYVIQAKQPATVFQSTVAPTVDTLTGIRQSGGAIQTLVPNRGLFTDVQRVGNLRIGGQP